jgi:hypothetical protein
VKTIHSILLISKKRFHRLVLLGCIAIFTAILLLSFVDNGSQERSSREVYEPFDTQQLSPDVLTIDTGIYVNRVHDVNLAAGTFAANGWLWMSWDKPQEGDWRLDEINIESIKFMNEIPNKSKRQKLNDEPYIEHGNRLWQGMRFSSTFLINNRDFSRFPFEKLELPIEISSDMFGIETAVFKPNIKDSLASDRLAVSGYEFRGLEALNFSHSISSKWGHSIPPDSPAHAVESWSYPHLEWVLQFSRLASSSIARLFTPVFAAMVVLIFSLLLNLSVASPKITIPASVLLVLAVLQDRSHKLLPPNITYLTYMDKVYLFCYLLTLITLISSLYCVNRLNKATGDDRAALQISLRSEQRTLVNWMCISLIVVPLALWYLQFD